MDFTKIGFLIVALSVGEISFANEKLLNTDSCVALASSNSSGFVAVGYESSSQIVAALTCQDLKTYKEGFIYTSLALSPAVLVIRANPAVKAMLLTEMMRLGLTLSNPVVLTVTVLGATGMAVIYIILKKEMDECEKMEAELLKKQIVRELKDDLGLSPNPGYQFHKLK